MNDSNPFASTRTPAPPAVAAETNKKIGRRTFEILNNVFRGLLAFLFVGLVPVFVVPNLQTVFEEFGVDLPTIAQLVFQLSQLACTAPFIFVSISFGTFAAVEFGIFSIPSAKWKTLINIGYWLALILVIGSACFSFVAILSQLVANVAANTELLPHLLPV